MAVVQKEKLMKFTQNVFLTYGVNKKDAFICADNLVLADMRGIPSHGVARLKRYVDGMNNGVILPLNKPEIVKETAVTANIDGKAGLGQIVGHFATSLAIKKAKQSGAGIVTVRNSNHYGIAGYYSQMILNENLLGISMTNSAPLVVPTFGREMVFGTNPISLTAPAKDRKPFFLDMATSVVPRGKLEVYNREGKPLPDGWAVDENGQVTTDPGKVLNNLLNRMGGGILPLGGEGELYSGYKGYGMAIFVDILSGVLSGGAYANLVNKSKNGKPAPANVSHFFMALDIENFVDLDTFTTNMTDLMNRLQNSDKATNQKHIFIHGEKEYVKHEKYEKEGIPLQDKVYDTLRSIAEQRKVNFDI
ncbi:Ldh family oxidoreductase [candidate division KSB1 bacterium]|nr:Ldh family oxidoreductase [candidate division KSB1 bacterium]